MEQKVDCYAAGERGLMAAGQRLRAVLLQPFLRGLARLRVSPDHLTFMSLLAGVLFCPAWFWSKTVAWMLLALHILLDGVDGPLARHLGVASNKGSFTDTMSDQVVIAGTTAALMASGEAGALAGMAYVVVYTTVVLFAFMRNALSVPYAWLVRPRFFVYAWFVVETYLWPGTLDFVLWTAAALLVLKVVSGFLRIRARL